MSVSDRQRLAQLVAANVRDLRIVADRNAEIAEIVQRSKEDEPERVTLGLAPFIVAAIRRSREDDAVLAARYGAPVDVIRSVR